MRLTAIEWNYQCLFQEQVQIITPARSSKGYLTLEVLLWVSTLVTFDQELTPWLGKTLQQCLRRSKYPACFTELREKILSSERAVQFSPFRGETEDEVLMIGKEFVEQYHWHSLRPLTDDLDRTKQSFAGEALEAKRGNLHCKKLFYTQQNLSFLIGRWKMDKEIVGCATGFPPCTLLKFQLSKMNENLHF